MSRSYKEPAMKSIMEEASTIVKAISQGWERAGKPREFSVKIFQEPERNFIGMTTRNAKIALFYTTPTENSPVTPAAKPSERPKKQIEEKVTKKAESRTPNRVKERPIKATAQEAHSPHHAKDITQETLESVAPVADEPRTTDIWSKEMIDIACEWVKDTVAAMELSDITCTADVHKYQLRLTLSKPLSTNESANKALMRDYSILILQALRNRYKRPLRGFKVIVACQ